MGNTITGVLPPDPEQMNEKRALWAEAALLAFQGVTGTDMQDAVCDLIADLLHWCDRHGLDFDDELRRGRGHYVEETSG